MKGTKLNQHIVEQLKYQISQSERSNKEIANQLNIEEDTLMEWARGEHVFNLLEVDAMELCFGIKLLQISGKYSEVNSRLQDLRLSHLENIGLLDNT